MHLSSKKSKTRKKNVHRSFDGSSAHALAAGRRWLTFRDSYDDQNQSVSPPRARSSP
jgi:hypothetical protein